MKLFLIIGVQSRKFPGLIFGATIITPGDTNAKDATAVACTLYTIRVKMWVYIAPPHFRPTTPLDGVAYTFCIVLNCIVLYSSIYIYVSQSPRSKQFWLIYNDVSIFNAE